MTPRAPRWGFAAACLAAASPLAAQSAAQPAGLQAPLLPSNHALIITVSEYQRSPLPGVLNDRKLANDLARRFGVPAHNIVELSEQEVTREGLKQALGGNESEHHAGRQAVHLFFGPRRPFLQQGHRAMHGKHRDAGHACGHECRVRQHAEASERAKPTRPSSCSIPATRAAWRRRRARAISPRVPPCAQNSCRRPRARNARWR